MRSMQMMRCSNSSDANNTSKGLMQVMEEMQVLQVMQVSLAHLWVDFRVILSIFDKYKNSKIILFYRILEFYFWQFCRM